MIKDFSQCDGAIINLLRGVKANGEEVPVIYINPEKEFVIAKYPTIAVYRAGIYPDNWRWTNDKFYDNISFDEEGNPISIDEREAPIPYNVYYGIRIYYQFQEDGMEINSQLLYILRRGAYVEIDGIKYDLEYVSYRNPNATYKDFGEQKENEDREFVEQYMYKLEVELDGAERVSKHLAKELVINVDVTKKEEDKNG